MITLAELPRVLVEQILLYATQKDILNLIRTFKKLGEYESTWKAYYRLYPTWHKFSTLGSFRALSMHRQQVRLNWRESNHLTSVTNIFTHPNSPLGLGIDPASDMVACSVIDKTLAIYDSTGRVLQRIKPGADESMWDPVVRKNMVITTGFHSDSFLWSVGGAKKNVYSWKGAIRSASLLDTSGNVLLSEGPALREYSAETGCFISERRIPGSSYVDFSQFGDDRVLGASHDMLLVWDLRQRLEIFRMSHKNADRFLCGENEFYQIGLYGLTRFDLRARKITQCVPIPIPKSVFAWGAKWTPDGILFNSDCSSFFLRYNPIDNSSLIITGPTGCVKVFAASANKLVYITRPQNKLKLITHHY